MLMWNALRATCASPRRWIALVALTILIFTLVILVPVWTTPGNDLLFQLSIMPWWQIVLAAVLALGNALVILMQWHLALVQRQLRARDVAAQTGLLASAIFATLACMACYSSLLSLLGLTGVIFIAKYRVLIAMFTLGITLWALYHTARRVTGVCASCNDIRQR